MNHSGMDRIENKENPDWEKAFVGYETVIASGNEDLVVKSTIKLAHLSKNLPENVLARTVPILAKLLGNSCSSDSVLSVQEAAAYCLKCIACQGHGSLAAEIGKFGVVQSILRLLPQSRDRFQRVLMKCLWCLVNFGNANRVIVARNGGLEIIVNMLNLCADRDKVCLLEILSALTLLREVRRVLIGFGGLRFLVEAARCGSMISRERACQAIGLIGVTRRVRPMLVALGVIPVLVELFRDGDATTKLVAGNSLGVISAHVDFIRPVAQAGAILLYAELIQGPDPVGREIAEDVFCILAVAEENAIAIADHLVRILREGDDGAKAAASDVLWDISGYKHLASVVRNSGAIAVLVELLKDGSGEVKEKVSGAIAQLSYDETDRLVLADAGALPILVELLDNELDELRDNAAEALVNFSEDPRFRNGLSEAVDAPSFQSMQSRLNRLRSSEEHMARSLRRMSVEQLTRDTDLNEFA